jgi:signal transduction histidine kinase
VTGAGPAGVRARELIHELNNSLGLVINYATLMAEDLSDHPQLVDDLTEIRNAGQRAADLVRELSAVLREGDGGGPVQA